jgi:hypothetical protein
VSNAAELAAIQAQSREIGVMAMPFVIVIFGVVLGFAMRRKDEDERFRMLPFAICLIIAIAGALANCPGARAQSRTSDGLPTFNFSIADLPALPSAAKRRMFDRAMSALAAANDGNGAAFSRFLKPNSKMKLQNETEITVELLQAITQNCTEAYPYDEGRNWVQFSWICDPSSVTTLSKFKSFQDSPELTATIWFENDLISEVVFREPLVVPGKRRVGFDAYSVLKGQR